MPSQRTDRPDYWHDPRFNNPSQPVVGVTWYEAMAYCRWLADGFKVSGFKFQVWQDGRFETCNLQPETITLPGEAQWEKAARGTDGRAWPWGSEWDAALANTREDGLEHLAPVGILPGGDSPYGVSDLVGGVWEWTVSLWGRDWQSADFGYPYRFDDGREDTAPGDDVCRVVRGGSWLSSREIARCAVRDRFDPYYSVGLIGFRCVSPVSL